jgi:alpha-L-rhamnosidase
VPSTWANSLSFGVAVYPRPGGGLTHAAASHETPYGRASISWRFEGDEMLVTMTVPPDCTATARLPGRPPAELGSGAHHAVVPRPVRHLL